LAVRAKHQGFRQRPCRSGTSYGTGSPVGSGHTDRTPRHELERCSRPDQSVGNGAGAMGIASHYAARFEGITGGDREWPLSGKRNALVGLPIDASLGRNHGRGSAVRSSILHVWPCGGLWAIHSNSVKLLLLRQARAPDGLLRGFHSRPESDDTGGLRE
jgi:hypothetical protein